MLINNPQINYIAIEGVIGTGKTSLSQMLAQRLNAKLILENFEDNPYLKKFYENPREYAFRTQLFFLIERFTHLQQVNQHELFQQYIISDYIFEKDRIFAYLTLSEEELKIYETVASSLNKSIVSPDLVIYLQSSVERLLRNIHQRNRDVEKNIQDDYIDNLNDAYNYFFSRFKSSRIMIVNCDEIDFVNNYDDFENLVREIFKPERGAVEYYNPAIKRKSAI